MSRHISVTHCVQVNIWLELEQRFKAKHNRPKALTKQCHHRVLFSFHPLSLCQENKLQPIRVDLNVKVVAALREHLLWRRVNVTGVQVNLRSFIPVND